MGMLFPQTHHWAFTLIATGEGDVGFVVATGTIEALTRERAEQMVVEAYWDPRLDAALCSPYVQLRLKN